MLRIATETKLTPQQVMGKAISFFGPDGLMNRQELPAVLPQG